MLVYVRQDMMNANTISQVPEDLKTLVLRDNGRLDEEYDAKKIERNAIELRISKRKEMYNCVFHTGATVDPYSAESSYLISTEWLRNWITGEEQITSTGEAKKKEKKPEVVDLSESPKKCLGSKCVDLRKDDLMELDESVQLEKAMMKAAVIESRRCNPPRSAKDLSKTKQTIQVSCLLFIQHYVISNAQKLLEEDRQQANKRLDNGQVKEPVENGQVGKSVVEIESVPIEAVEIQARSPWQKSIVQSKYCCPHSASTIAPESMKYFKRISGTAWRSLVSFAGGTDAVFKGDGQY